MMTTDKRTVKRHDAEDEHERQRQHNDRVDLEAGRLVRVETQHGAARAAGARSARAAGADIGELLLLVGRRATTDLGAGTAGDRWGRGAAEGGTGGGARGGAGWRGGARGRLQAVLADTIGVERW